MMISVNDFNRANVSSVKKGDDSKILIFMGSSKEFQAFFSNSQSNSSSLCRWGIEYADCIPGRGGRYFQTGILGITHRIYC